MSICDMCHRWIGQVFLVMLVVPVSLEGCQGHANRTGQEPPSVELLSPTAAPTTAPSSLPLSREQGGRLFSTLCSACHGIDGRGQTDLAVELQPPPAGFHSCNFKYRSTPSGSLPTDDDLLRTLYVGLPGTAMPSLGGLLPFRALSALAQEVKDRCPRFNREEPEEPLSIPRAPLYQETSVTSGQHIYQREKCASCHGQGGRGDGPAATALKDLLGRPVRPRDYTRGVFRSGFRRVDIFRAFSTGLDGTPMPALPDSVSAKDRWDLTHYLVSLSYRRNQIWRAVRESPSWYEPARAWGVPWR